MNTKKLLIIISVTFIFITLFCDKNIEGLANEEVEAVRCGEEDNTFFQVTKECMSISDNQAFSCNNDTVSSDDCMDNCIVPILENNSLGIEHLLDESSFSEVRPVIEEIISTCEPIDNTVADEPARDNEDFGIDCVNNCEVFYHDCEIKEEIETVDGKRKRVKTYNNIENCPNGEIPDQKCSDSGWGCKVCKRGYYPDHDGLCKPLPRTGFIISIILIVIIVGGLILFSGIKIKKWFLKRNSGDMPSGI